VTGEESVALPEVDASQFFGIDIRVGTVVSCETFPQARRPAYKMVIDFGPLGTRRSSGRLTDHYRPEQLTGSTVVAVVNCFVNSQRVGAVVDEAIANKERLGIGALWLQLGVIDQDAAQRAIDAGLDVVMDTCPMIEYPKL